MTGLFHRLARQVVGPELPRARTTARLPFAGPLAPEMQNIEPPRGSAPKLADPHGPSVSDGNEAARGRETHAKPARLLPTTGPPPAASPGGAAPNAGEPEQSGSELTAAELTAAGPAPVSVRHAGPLHDPATRGSVDVPPAEDCALEAPPEGQPSAEARRDNPGPRDASSAVAPPAPRPLLPESTPPATAEYRTAVPDAPARRREPAEAGPAEVHVHIGRIDVASVSESQQQRREPPRRRAKPPMSLEDYLAKRKSGGT